MISIEKERETSKKEENQEKKLCHIYIPINAERERAQRDKTGFSFHCVCVCVSKRDFSNIMRTKLKERIFLVGRMSSTKVNTNFLKSDFFILF